MKLNILLILFSLFNVINSHNCYNDENNNIIKGNILKYYETTYNCIECEYKNKCSCYKSINTQLKKKNSIKNINTPYINGNIVYIYKNIYNNNLC
jgi:hypothetical protein